MCLLELVEHRLLRVVPHSRNSNFVNGPSRPGRLGVYPDVFATNKRLIAESVALRKKAKELQALADELMAEFKRDHPES